MKGGSNLFESIPNEVFRQILEHLFPKHLQGVTRVNLMWRFLANSGLIPPAMHKLNKKYPFLMTKETLERVPYSGYDVLLKKQKNNYFCLAREHGLLPKYLKRAYLQTFFSLDQMDKDKHFTPRQIAFLEDLAIASGVTNSIKEESKEDIFLLMAEIGNAQKLAEWIEKYKEDISYEYKQWAFWRSAENGHLECMTCLLEIYQKDILEHDEGEALLRAAENGHLECMTYLLEIYQKDILEHDKGKALLQAAENGHLVCVMYLIQTFGSQIIAEDKEQALCKAAQGGHFEYIS